MTTEALSMAEPPGTFISIKVLPRSSKNEIVGKDPNGYKIKLTAPPLEGKANKALIQLMAKKLRVPKRDIQIVSGTRSKHKSLHVTGLSAKAVEKLLLDNSGRFPDPAP